MRPEDMIWQFGSGRTGSTWLSRMVRDMPGFSFWGEPMVGKLVGDLWRWSGHEKRRVNEHYVFCEDHPELWQLQLRSFVLSLAKARTKGGYLWVCEPNGAQGAVVISRVLPESRFVLLLRDPRDVVASFLDAASGGWMGERAIQNPDRFVRGQARRTARSFGWALEAYKEHQGPKARLRYEDLRAEPVATLSSLLADLGLPVPAEVPAAVERWSWENPAHHFEHGPGKKRRKALPGSWREDLTPEQARTVERTCSAVLDSFY